MKKGFLVIFIFYVATAWSQQDSFKLQPPPSYWDALKYLQSFKTDSEVIKFLAETNIEHTSRSNVTLAVSNDFMPANYSLLAHLISKSSICNSTNLTSQALYDSLFAFDRKLAFAHPFEWPDSVTRIQKPDMVVFFSAPYKNLFSAGLFDNLGSKNATQRNKDISYLLFLFCTDENGKVVLIHKGHITRFVSPHHRVSPSWYHPQYELPSDSLVEKGLKENSDNR
jgi:hypothetical protein